MNTLIAKIYLFVLVVSFVGCAQTEKPTSITVDELRKEIKENKNLVILDVRTPQELTGPLGKIEGVINIPVQDLENRIKELDDYKDKDIAVICRTGNRSAKGTEILNEHGFHAKNVLGGMTEYRATEKK